MPNIPVNVAKEVLIKNVVLGAASEIICEELLLTCFVVEFLLLNICSLFLLMVFCVCWWEQDNEQSLPISFTTQQVHNKSSIIFPVQ